ncbi:MAG: tRNA lysidine(34) synthetase TilS [Parcubacteria group bacterium]|jgi:tRNA(Ile)-lysidine synthase
MMTNLIKTIQNTASLNNLWGRTSKIVVGVSGGPDSVCLLDILAGIKEKSEIELHIVHVNYALRGKDSDKDEKIVENLADNYAFGLSVLKIGGFKKNNISEEILRNIRYDFFEKIRKELNYDLVAVAHNQDDQVETFLIHLIRGAGLQGLAGMKYKNNKIIRPLLGISRKEISEYLKNERLKYRTDKTNKEDIFLRNKVRNKLIPILEKNFNPNIKKTIFDSTLNIFEDMSLISELSGKQLNKLEVLRASWILKLHPALQKRMILKKIEFVKGDLKNIESSHVEEILKIIKSTKSKNQRFSFQGLKLTRKGDRLNLAKIN